MDDPFIREHIGDVLRSLRTQWILTTIKPYTRVELPYLARQLRIPTKDVEEIVVALILDERIQGRVDQVSQRLELDRQCVLSFSLASVDPRAECCCCCTAKWSRRGATPRSTRGPSASRASTAA